MKILIAILLAILALGTMPVSAFAFPDDPGYGRQSK